MKLRIVPIPVDLHQQFDPMEAANQGRHVLMGEEHEHFELIREGVVVGIECRTLTIRQAVDGPIGPETKLTKRKLQ